MNKKEIKKRVIITLFSYYKNQNLGLPIPIKKIVKSISNIRLIKYSTYMKDNNFNLNEMIEYAGSIDAFTDYDAEHDEYIIAYNDMNKDILKSYRYRWSIAHELGHIMLEHHKNNNTKLFRNSLSEAEYNRLEYEDELRCSC